MMSQSDSRQPWYHAITRYQWTVLLIASLGWVFDVFEGQIFVTSMNEAMPSLLPAEASDGIAKYYNNIALGKSQNHLPYPLLKLSATCQKLEKLFPSSPVFLKNFLIKWRFSACDALKNAKKENNEIFSRFKVGFLLCTHGKEKQQQK